MQGWTIYCDIKDDISKCKIEELAVDFYTTLEGAQNGIKTLVHKMVQGLKSEGLVVEWGNENLSEIYAINGFGNYINCKFYIKGKR